MSDDKQPSVESGGFFQKLSNWTDRCRAFAVLTIAGVPGQVANLPASDDKSETANAANEVNDATPP